MVVFIVPTNALAYELESSFKNNVSFNEYEIFDKNKTINKEEIIKMANKTLVPEAKEALDKFKMEAANEVGVNLKQGYNGDLTSRQAGSIGGQMVKKMIESYERQMQ